MQSNTNDDPEKALSQVLQWACSPRGGNNFWGRVLNGCGRRAVNNLGTAAVSLTQEGKYQFLWDPQFFSSIDTPLRILVVIHEATHIVLQHLIRGMRYKQFCKHEYQWAQLMPIVNMAQDFAANDISLRSFMELSNFRKHHKTLLFPENDPYNFPEGKSFDEYLSLLLDKCETDSYSPYQQETDANGTPIFVDSGIPIPSEGDGSNSDGNAQGKESSSPDTNQKSSQPVNQAPQWLKDVRGSIMPQHIRWEDLLDHMTEAEAERIIDRAKREAKRITKKAAQQTHKSRGTLPGSVQGIIDDLLSEPTLPWYEILRNFLKSSISSKLAESTAWPHMGILTTGQSQGIEPFPGMQKDFSFFITVAIDTSGSVSDEDFIKFMSEIQGIMKSNESVTTRILLYDAGLQKEFLIEADEEITNYCTRHGYGGTNFCPPFRRMLQLDKDEDWVNGAERLTRTLPRTDLFVNFTDGYAPVHSSQGGPMPELTPPCPFIWILTNSGKENAHMGDIVLKIDD